MRGTRREQFDRSTPIPRSADEPLFLQIGEVFVDRRERRQVEALADFFEARRVAVLLDELLEIVQNLALTFRERLHGHPPLERDRQTIRKEKAKIN